MKPSKANICLSWSWALVWLTLPLSPRLSVMSLWVFALMVIINASQRKIRPDRPSIAMLTGLTLLFLWHLMSLLTDSHTTVFWKDLERKAAWLLVPVIMLFANGLIVDKEKWMARGLFLGLIISGIHMLIMGGVNWFQYQDLNEVIYHNFTQAYHLGAIYYSWYLSIAIFYLLFKPQEDYVEKYKWPLLVFFVLLLLLAASKLFVILTLPVVLWKAISSHLSLKARIMTLGGILLLLFFGLQPFYARMAELKDPGFGVMEQEQFTYDSDFNGLSIRLLQWRFGYEILEEHEAWLLGVGVGSKQKHLNEYYKKYGVYTGNPELGDTGYLNYNFHNQYMESLVGGGFIGLFLLLLVLIYHFIYHKKLVLFPLGVYIVMALFFLTESVLDRQSGLLMFCLILCAFVSPLHNRINNYGSPSGR